MYYEFYTKFYDGKVKIVPSDLSLLTPLALAHLIMQDGARGPTCKARGEQKDYIFVQMLFHMMMLNGLLNI